MDAAIHLTTFKQQQWPFNCFPYKTIFISSYKQPHSLPSGRMDERQLPERSELYGEVINSTAHKTHPNHYLPESSLHTWYFSPTPATTCQNFLKTIKSKTAVICNNNNNNTHTYIPATEHSYTFYLQRCVAVVDTIIHTHINKPSTRNIKYNYMSHFHTPIPEHNVLNIS